MGVFGFFWSVISNVSACTLGHLGQLGGNRGHSRSRCIWLYLGASGGICFQGVFACICGYVGAYGLSGFCSFPSELRLGPREGKFPLNKITLFGDSGFCTADWNERVGSALCLPARSAHERERERVLGKIVLIQLGFMLR